MPVCGTISIAFPPNAPPKNSTHTYDLICFDHDSVKNPRKHATKKKNIQSQITLFGISTFDLPIRLTLTFTLLHGIPKNSPMCFWSKRKIIAIIRNHISMTMK